MSTDTTKHRKPPPLRFVISHADAALALSISERTLDEWVAAGALHKRRVSKKRVGYLVREVEALAESLPVVTPGVEHADQA